MRYSELYPIVPSVICEYPHSLTHCDTTSCGGKEFRGFQARGYLPRYTVGGELRHQGGAKTRGGLERGNDWRGTHNPPPLLYGTHSPGDRATGNKRRQLGGDHEGARRRNGPLDAQTPATFSLKRHDREKQRTIRNASDPAAQGRRCGGARSLLRQLCCTSAVVQHHNPFPSFALRHRLSGCPDSLRAHSGANTGRVCGGFWLFCWPLLAEFRVEYGGARVHPAPSRPRSTHPAPPQTYHH